jgi:hypothetical protein
MIWKLIKNKFLNTGQDLIYKKILIRKSRLKNLKK